MKQNFYDHFCMCITKQLFIDNLHVFYKHTIYFILHRFYPSLAHKIKITIISKKVNDIMWKKLVNAYMCLFTEESDEYVTSFVQKIFDMKCIFHGHFCKYIELFIDNLRIFHKHTTPPFFYADSIQISIQKNIIISRKMNGTMRKNLVNTFMCLFTEDRDMCVNSVLYGMEK